MSALTTQQLWQKLQQEGLVTGGMPPVRVSASPWFVRVMLGVAGWIGALFLIGFVGAACSLVLKSAETSMLLGVAGCGAAYGIFRLAQTNDFAMQLGLALSFAGQGLFIFGLFDAFKWESSIAYFSILGFELLLAIVIPNFIHRVLTSWAAMLALTFALSRLGIHGFASGIAAAGFAVIWSNEWCWALHGKLWRPIGYGLGLALLQIETLHFVSYDIWKLWAHTEPDWLMRHAHTISTALITATLLGVVTRLLNRENLPLSSKIGMMAISAALLLGILSFAAPGVATALLILVLGFATGNRLLMGLGLLALGVFVSHYYYQLHNTLLFKSIVLAISGTVLLIVRFGLQKCFPLTGARENQDA
ncbi:MAG: DUF4401 domain-containing protein [Methylococcaceae bacterium]